MGYRNVGGCDCRDCNNGRTMDRSWWKRIWKKEIEAEVGDLIFYDLDPNKMLPGKWGNK